MPIRTSDHLLHSADIRHVAWEFRKREGGIATCGKCSGTLLGNFPQALIQLGLISGAVALARAES